MSTLLLRLAAPLQSWGIDSKYNRRSTNRDPSKSGVIGLLAAAMGLSRNDSDSLVNLFKLRFGVRIEQEGNLLIDYQNAIGPFIKNDNTDNYQYILSEDKTYLIKYCSDKKITTTQTWRSYLTDAVFLVGLEGARNELEKLAVALNHPVFPLFLGRRSCPPMPPVVLGIRDLDLCQALRDEPWWALDWYKNKWAKTNQGKELFLRIQYEPAEGEAYQAIQRDQPITFDQSHRKYGYRGYTAKTVNIQPEVVKSGEEFDDYLTESNETEEHDPMKELEE